MNLKCYYSELSIGQKLEKKSGQEENPTINDKKERRVKIAKPNAVHC